MKLKHKERQKYQGGRTFTDTYGKPFRFVHFYRLRCIPEPGVTVYFCDMKENALIFTTQKDKSRVFVSCDKARECGEYIWSNWQIDCSIEAF